MADDLYHIRFSSEFVAAWRDLVSNVFRWRVDEGFALCPGREDSPRGHACSAAELQRPEPRRGAGASHARAPHSISVKVLPDASETGRPKRRTVSCGWISKARTRIAWEGDLRPCRNRARVSSGRTTRWSGRRVIGRSGMVMRVLVIMRRDGNRMAVLRRRRRSGGPLLKGGRPSPSLMHRTMTARFRGCGTGKKMVRPLTPGERSRSGGGPLRFRFGVPPMRGRRRIQEKGGAMLYRAHVSSSPLSVYGAMKRRLASGGGFLRGSRTGWVRGMPRFPEM